MGATSGITICTGALQIIGVLQEGQTPSGNTLSSTYRRLQNMMGSLAIQPKTIPVIAREVFPLVAFKGGPTNPYSIGPGGDFDTSRPNDLEGAGLLLNAGLTNEEEIPRALYTDDGWEAIQIKTQQNGLFTGVYYSQTFPLGTINLWPIPNTTINSLVLYRADQLGTFASPTAIYYVPNGYDDMLEYQLAMRLAGIYRRQLTPEQLELARESLALVKRANYRITDVPIDPALTMSRRYGYNIQTSNL